MKLAPLLLVLIAPLPFWILGLPWLLKGGDSGRIRLAPLVGCALAGFFAELALILGLHVRASVGTAVLASAGIALWKGRQHIATIKHAVGEWLPIYFVAVLAASISPFPVIGDWSGDWHLLYEMGESVIQGRLGSDMLARPPLFGAAATPLWIVGSGLIPYQLMAAVASAAAVTAILVFVDHFWPRSPRVLLLPLLLSPFFLHHAAAAWAKVLAGGLILSSIFEALRGRRVASGALFALAVAVHEGSIVWAPCVLLAHGSSGAGWRGVGRALLPMAAFGLLIAGPIQIWVLMKYGLEAKIASSPAITARDHTPFLVKNVLGVVNVFVGWGPIPSLARWLRNPARASFAVASKESYWFITIWITTMAGTLAGLLFPFLFVRRSALDSPTVRRFLRPWPLVAISFPIVGGAMLAGFSSDEGTMQHAVSALALASYGILAGQLASGGEQNLPLFRRMAWVMGVVGTLPWVLANLLTSTGLWLSAAFRERMRTGSEADYFRIVDNHLASLGMAAFPQVPLLCVAALLILLGLRRRSMSVKDATPSGLAP